MLFPVGSPCPVGRRGIRRGTRTRRFSWQARPHRLRRLRCSRRSSNRVPSYPEIRRASGRRPQPWRNPRVHLACSPAPRPGRWRWARFLDRCLRSVNRRLLAPWDRSRSEGSQAWVNGSIGRRESRRQGHSRSRFLRSRGWRYPFLITRTRCRSLQCRYRPSGVWNCPLRPARSTDRRCLFRRRRFSSRSLPRHRRSRCLLPRRPSRCPYQHHCPRPRSR